MHAPDDSALREEIAAVAARFIAEDGLDYAGAKQRAAREVIGDRRRHQPDCMPDNALVEAAVREHQALFMADTQPLRLAHLRTVARDVMRFLVAAGEAAGMTLEPFVTGAVVNGTAGDHSDVHLQLFDDRVKDIEIMMLNAGADFAVSEVPGSRDGELLSFLWPWRRVGPGGHRDTPAQEAVHLTICDARDRRPAQPAQHVERAGLASLERLMGIA